jgi:hypothetical protein
MIGKVDCSRVLDVIEGGLESLICHRRIPHPFGWNPSEPLGGGGCPPAPLREVRLDSRDRASREMVVKCLALPGSEGS